jgi:hypothetical protein
LHRQQTHNKRVCDAHVIPIESIATQRACLDRQDGIPEVRSIPLRGTALQPQTLGAICTNGDQYETDGKGNYFSDYGSNHIWFLHEIE